MMLSMTQRQHRCMHALARGLSGSTSVLLLTLMSPAADLHPPRQVSASLKPISNTTPSGRLRRVARKMTGNPGEMHGAG
ncbi:hypothetical protein LX36DRAFT_340922 [Colletotrichum falcatum]|nr:hypothetical protein LX36DRAFT_340922 [Colletotrichum falcatum]